MTKAEQVARVERIRERIKDLRRLHAGNSDILELLANLAERS